MKNKKENASTSSLLLLRLVVGSRCLFNEILLPTSLDRHALHLVQKSHRTFPACCLQVSIECCLELLLRLLHLRNCRIDSCGESCYDVVHVPCVDFLLQVMRSQTGTFRRCTTVQPRTSWNPALDLACLVLDSSFCWIDVRGTCFLMATPSDCPCWTTASVLGCFGRRLQWIAIDCKRNQL